MCKSYRLIVKHTRKFIRHSSRVLITVFGTNLGNLIYVYEFWGLIGVSIEQYFSKLEKRHTISLGFWMCLHVFMFYSLLFEYLLIFSSFLFFKLAFYFISYCGIYLARSLGILKCKIICVCFITFVTFLKVYFLEVNRHTIYTT